METMVISEMVHYFEHEMGYIIPPMMPFVGSSFNMRPVSMLIA